MDYELTELGQSLQKPICGLATWAMDNVEAIHQAQARFDRQAGSAQLDAYVASLRAKAKIDVKPGNLEPK